MTATKVQHALQKVAAAAHNFAKKNSLTHRGCFFIDTTRIASYKEFMKPKPRPSRPITELFSRKNIRRLMLVAAPAIIAGIVSLKGPREPDGTSADTGTDTAAEIISQLRDERQKAKRQRELQQISSRARQSEPSEQPEAPPRLIQINPQDFTFEALKELPEKNLYEPNKNKHDRYPPTMSKDMFVWDAIKDNPELSVAYYNNLNNAEIYTDDEFVHATIDFAAGKREEMSFYIIEDPDQPGTFFIDYQKPSAQGRSGYYENKWRQVDPDNPEGTIKTIQDTIKAIALVNAREQLRQEQEENKF